MNQKFFWKIVSIARVWFQSFLAIEVAMHIKDLIKGGFIWQVCVAAFVPVVIRWATPHDEFPDEKVKP